MFHRMMNYGEMDVRPTVTLTRDLIKKTMPKFKRHDDLIIIQEKAWIEFKNSLPIAVAVDENSPFSIDEDELASLVCQTVQKPICRRLAIERGVKSDDYRSPDVCMILGDDGVVNRKENHITYRFDVTKCMFSFGNITEKMRMASLDCSNETVVDLFAGIGYFSIPLLVHAKARQLYACEWNPDSIEALKKNLTLNKVDPSRYTVIEGDNRSNRPTDVAQRVILGILPSCADWMQTAFECMDKTTGATFHCHDLVDTKSNSVQVDKQSSTTSFESAQSQLELDKSKSESQILSNQSVSSSSSSHSTIEKLSVPTEERSHSSESDKDISTPNLLEKPTNSPLDQSNNEINDSTSKSSNNEDSINESLKINDSMYDLFEARGRALIDLLKEDLATHDMSANLIRIEPVKSYAPHVTHVVFDIKLEPNTQQVTDYLKMY